MYVPYFVISYLHRNFNEINLKTVNRMVGTLNLNTELKTKHNKIHCMKYTQQDYLIRQRIKFI